MAGSAEAVIFEGPLERVGFIGLGNIGEHMARRLCGGSFETVVFDLREEAVGKLVESGAKAAGSAREVAERSQVLGICVVDDASTEAVVSGPGGVLEGAAPGTVIALHSTIHPETARSIAARALSQDVQVIDAQMTGGAAAAASGKLRYMVGGAPAVVDRCRPYLEAGSSEITHCGDLGMGAVAKLCNNLAQFVAWVGFTEAARLADHAGLEREKLLEVLSWIMNDNARVFLTARTALEADPENAGLKQAFGAAAALAEKDLRLALEVGREAEVSLPGTAHTWQSVARLFGLPDPKRR